MMLITLIFGPNFPLKAQPNRFRFEALTKTIFF